MKKSETTALTYDITLLFSVLFLVGIGIVIGGQVEIAPIRKVQLK